MPITAIRYIRKMRGGAQAHLLEADDGHWYVVKFRNNPQHRRILINEMVCSVLLDYLQISAPPTALIHLSQTFLDANPDVHLRLGAQRVAVESGWHFGSRYPGDPSRVAVYDFLPDALLEKVLNRADFRAILVFDKWAANSDGRQCAFYRAKVMREDGAGQTQGFVARMIDHGFGFNGPHWDFPESAVQGLYGRRVVYDDVRSLDDFQPWLDQIRHFPEEVMDRAWKCVPSEWLGDDEEALQVLLERLFERRKLVADAIHACRRSSVNPFPNWK
jgi:hypothetical protein